MTVVLDTNTYSEWVRDGRWAEVISELPQSSFRHPFWES